MTENQPKINADIPAKSTAKKFFVLSSRNTANTHKIVTSKRRMAVTKFSTPNISFHYYHPEVMDVILYVASIRTHLFYSK
jgi:hypothetical protein